MVEELGVGEVAEFAGFALPDEGGLVTERAGGVAVDAIVGEVELAAGEPGGGAHLAFEDFGPGGEPVELGGGFGPEGFGVGDAALVEGVVFASGFDPGASGELDGWGEDAVLAEEGVHVLM